VFASFWLATGFRSKQSTCGQGSPARRRPRAKLYLSHLSSFRLRAQILQPTVVEHCLSVSAPSLRSPICDQTRDISLELVLIQRPIAATHFLAPRQHRKTGAAIDLVGPRPRPRRHLVQFPLRTQACSIERALTGLAPASAASERVVHFILASGWFIQCGLYRSRQLQHVLLRIGQRTDLGLQDPFSGADSAVPQP